MGVTIHFCGKLRDKNAYQRLMNYVSRISLNNGWICREINKSKETLLRVDGEEKSYEYVGPVNGILVEIDKNCDPLNLEFDNKLFIQEYIKTQFAGVEIHITIIELLRKLVTEFEYLKVDDEGEYWNTNNRSILQKHFINCHEALNDFLRENPSKYGPVRLPDGRIIDAMDKDS